VRRAASDFGALSIITPLISFVRVTDTESEP
jgi:hypothetical protein